MDTSIYFAPLQSFTTLAYYFAFQDLVGGIDKYFTPFYRVEKDGSFSFEKQLGYREDINILPQVLTNKGEELVLFASEMEKRGFKEINLNLGCPFPMVVNRQLGSGLLPFSKELEKMLEAFYSINKSIKLSVKLRLGSKDTEEIYSVMDILKQYPIEETILHPRLGIQKYKGVPDWQTFSELSKMYKLTGNGDITSKERLEELKHQFPDCAHWMIGRGLLMNPCMLKPELDLKNTMVQLHERFLDYLKAFGLSDQQILNQLKCFWEYPSQFLDGGQRVLRKMKKVGSMQSYLDFKVKMFRLYE